MPDVTEILARRARGEELTGGDITFLAWEAFARWCDEQGFDDEVDYDIQAHAEAYAAACSAGWLPPWERK